ncbi:hypothetical protein [Streptomyces sp. NPDC056160]|uniref:hypothetical protein n=1 Tax=Streptomyces sp. NPDC056160 TaxID=3345731 RepID=UPI0035DB02A2
MGWYPRLPAVAFTAAWGRATTKRWQHRYAAAGLVADGIVGPKTVHYAGRALDEAGGDRYVYVGLTANHKETGRYVTFVRSSSGVWSMYLGDELRPLYYGKATFNACR